MINFDSNLFNNPNLLEKDYIHKLIGNPDINIDDIEIINNRIYIRERNHKKHFSSLDTYCCNDETFTIEYKDDILIWFNPTLECIYGEEFNEDYGKGSEYWEMNMNNNKLIDKIGGSFMQMDKNNKWPTYSTFLKFTKYYTGGNKDELPEYFDMGGNDDFDSYGDYELSPVMQFVDPRNTDIFIEIYIRNSQCESYTGCYASYIRKTPISSMEPQTLRMDKKQMNEDYLMEDQELLCFLIDWKLRWEIPLSDTISEKYKKYTDYWCDTFKLGGFVLTRGGLEAPTYNCLPNFNWEDDKIHIFDNGLTVD